MSRRFRCRDDLRPRASSLRRVVAIRAAIDEALKCKETGEEKNIVFGLTGTGYFDMVAYQRYNDGEMTDTIPTDEELQHSLARLPAVPGQN